MELFSLTGPVVSFICSFGQGHVEAWSPVPLSCLVPSCEKTRSYAVVTGANRSIGYETSRKLLQKGHIVIILCRNQRLGTEVVNGDDANDRIRSNAANGRQRFAWRGPQVAPLAASSFASSTLETSTLLR